MKLNKLFSQSRNSEADSVVKKIYSTYEMSSLAGDVHLSKMMGELREISLGMTSAIGAIATESVLENEDSDRDEANRSLFNFVKGQCSHPSKVVRENAESVWDVIDSFGVGINSESYNIQTSLEDSMLEKLEEPKIVESIAKVPGVDILIAAVKTTNTAFAESHIAYEHAKAGDTQKVSATEIKKQILTLINYKILVYLRAMALVDEPVFGEFTRVVGQIIDDNNRNVRNR
jgi:hypothetical protein